MSTDRSFRLAVPSEASMLAATIADALADDPVTEWLFRGSQDRKLLLPLFFQVPVDAALAEGIALTTEALDAVTLWLDVDPASPPSPSENAEMHQHLRSRIGQPAAARFEAMDDLMGELHPHDAHAYLPFIAVAPGRQGQGVGEALLRQRLVELDAAGRPAYLEASTLRSAALYARLGFVRMSPTIDLPDGPSLYPMWREAAR